jgi:hypothetical protein
MLAIQKPLMLRDNLPHETRVASDRHAKATALIFLIENLEGPIPTRPKKDGISYRRMPDIVQRLTGKRASAGLPNHGSGQRADG